MYSFQLLHAKPSKPNFSGEKIAQIYIQKHTSDEEGRILITPRCFSFSEIKNEVCRLKRELDLIQQKAKKGFRK